MSITAVKDANGQEHDDKGRFGQGGGGAAEHKAKSGILSRAKSALSRAGEIARSGVQVPAKVLSAAKRLGAAAMSKIENRYGSKIKNAVSIAVLVALPIPVPGMSAALAAPILAFAELHRQLARKARADAELGIIARSAKDDELDHAEIKSLAEEVLRELFGGKIPKQIDLDEIDNHSVDAQAKPRLSMAKPLSFKAHGFGGVATIAAAGDGEGEKLVRFEGNAYTGAPMRPTGWGIPLVVDLEGVKTRSQHRPALRQHDHEQIVGHTDSVKVDPTGIHIAGVFSGEEQHVKKVTDPAKKGFQWQLSIGADPVRLEYLKPGQTTTVNGREITGPADISRETELGEFSFVPLGADGDTSAAVLAEKGKVAMFEKLALKLARTQGIGAAAEYSDDEIDAMSKEECSAALKKCMKAEDDDAPAEAAVGDEDKEGEDEDKPPEKQPKAKAKGKNRIQADRQSPLALSRKQQADEYRRVNNIQARCQKYGGIDKCRLQNGDTVDLIPHAIENGWSADQAEAAAELHFLRANRPSTGLVPGGLAYSTSTPAVNDAVVEAAVLHVFRHQLKIDDDSMYVEAAPDGQTPIRRVPVYLQKEIQGQFRSRYTDQVQQAAHTLFRGRITLKQLLTICAQKSGFARHQFSFDGQEGVRDFLHCWDRMPIQAEGASDMSIGNILANVMNKFSLQGYLFTEQAWREIAAIRPVNDFKPVKSINLLGDVMFKQLGPTGEIANLSIQDQVFSNVAQPFGRIGTIPWTHIVNDDLGILQTIPLKLGQGAGLALNDWFWALWASLASGSVVGTTLPSNYTLTADDGVSFWRTSSNTTAGSSTQYKPNKTSGVNSPFSSTSLTTVKALFDNQIDPNGNPLGFDGMTPIVLHGPTNWRAVQEILNAPGYVYGGGSASLQANNNPFQGMFRPVMSRYIENANYVNSTTAWWMLFNPIALPVIEVCFLNGVDTPAVLQAGPDFQFDRLGISMRGTMPFGANQQNFRGGVYSVGA